ncbi:MAG: hypothetical protein KC505_07520 [Myxococcales bacterium]|nr:hypothetical protein [Myxococcales bacterium]USN50613.1 MAG: hypothetical protein H6731_10175 [Myxococcales bacterium]
MTNNLLLTIFFLSVSAFSSDFDPNQYCCSREDWDAQDTKVQELSFHSQKFLSLLLVMP